MKFIHDQLQKYEHLFLKGGKLEKLYPLWEANESFLFTPKTVTRKGPHVRDGLDSKRMMSMVIVALIPCILLGAYNVGWQMAMAQGPAEHSFQHFVTGLIQIFPIILCSYAVGGIWEVIFAVVRGHEINEGFLVTGILFPLTLPPEIPLWQVALGISFGVVIGKEMFGGTGMNILNPALTARAFLYFAFPVQISGDKVWVAVDGFSGATPLSVAASTPVGQSAAEAVSNFSLGEVAYSMSNMFYGLIPGSIGETSALACLIGAVVLIASGIGSWRIMLSALVGTALTTWGFNAISDGGMLSLPPEYHIVMGGYMFGLVFMATDPVSAARTEMGKYVYGFLIGVLVVLIRIWNPAYPEGMMLAILFLNIFAPLIDHYVVQSNVKRRLNRVAA